MVLTWCLRSDLLCRICFVGVWVWGVREGVIMAVVVEAVGGGEVCEFLSPLRILVRSFRWSRDQWKGKAGRRKVEVKRLKVSLHDVKKSRATWRVRAEAAEGELAALRARTATPAEAPSPNIEAPPKKRTRAAS